MANPENGKGTEMKYYIYRSASKIDMLWEQLSSKEVEKYSGELKVNLGVLSAGIKSEQTDKNLHGKLEVVLKHLKAGGQIGDLDNPLAFFQGVMPMTWQEVSFYRGQSDQRMVLFSGYKHPPEKLVGLVGSAAYVTGMNDLQPESLGYAQPQFWTRVIETLNVPNQEEIEQNLYDVDNMIDYQARRRADGPSKQVLEFVAKTFIVKGGFIVGSPLYVAEASNEAHG